MQLVFEFGAKNLKSDIAAWEQSESEKGQIYTRPKVVEFMLTAIGLNTIQDFKNARILEPSCGEGEFVVAIVNRLINLPKARPSVTQLSTKLLAVDLVTQSLEISKRKVASLLKKHGYSASDVSYLLNKWFKATDFLLEDIQPNFTHVIGNPPYVRVENIPKNLLNAYRRRFSTMTNRADLYIPFFEKCLSLLVPGGRLSFICTDRWTKNTYGRSLRSLISRSFGLELFIDLYGADAFDKDVMTYPAITQLIKGKSDQTIFKNSTTFKVEEAKEVAMAIKGKTIHSQTRTAIVNGEKPWLFGSSNQISLIKKLEKKFPLLEDAGCKVFIGAATGLNKVFMVDNAKVGSEIEEDRLLPVITANDLKGGSIAWQNRYLINTYDENGVINLENFPKLSNYLMSWKDELSKRHVAKKNPEQWFKTIDRVYQTRAKREKLLIPDISSDPIVLFDSGTFHPNNSIYYICSETWSLHALRVILLSSITKLFISTYSTKIAKGFLRFQAQHLRKLRIPNWHEIEQGLQKRLINAGELNNTHLFDELTFEVYALTSKQKSALGI